MTGTLAQCVRERVGSRPVRSIDAQAFGRAPPFARRKSSWRRTLTAAGRLCAFSIAALAFPGLPAGGSVAAEVPGFAFLAPPDEDLLRLYWLNRQTGQVGACEYQPNEDKARIGTTSCFPAGEGSGPLGPGRYDLKASHHTDDGSVFRVNIDTGEISICWVRDKVVCTAPAR
jgi:hypothetical protein